MSNFLSFYSICIVFAQAVGSLGVPTVAMYEALESEEKPLKRFSHEYSSREKFTWDLAVPWQRNSCNPADLICGDAPCEGGTKRKFSAEYGPEHEAMVAMCQIPDADDFVSSFSLRAMLLAGKVMETHLGDVLSAEAAVEQIVATLVERWLKLLSTLLDIDDLAEAPEMVLKSSEPQASGSVEPEQLKTVLESGIIREKLTYIYSTVGKAAGHLPKFIKEARESKKCPDKISQLIDNGIINKEEWDARVDNTLTTDAGVKFSIEFGDGKKPNYGIFPGTAWGPMWVANQRNYRFSASEWGGGATESTCRSSVSPEEFDADDVLSPLTARELEVMKAETDTNNPGELLVTWCPGDNLHAVKPDTEFTRAAHLLGFNTMAGPSGTTDRFMGIGKFLNLKPKELKILKRALLAWMLPAHDHSFIEICMGAEPHCTKCRQVTDETTFKMKENFGVDHYLEILGEPESWPTWEAAGRTDETYYEQYKERHAQVKANFEDHVSQLKKKVLSKNMALQIEPALPGSAKYLQTLMDHSFANKGSSWQKKILASRSRRDKHASEKGKPQD